MSAEMLLRFTSVAVTCQIQSLVSRVSAERKINYFSILTDFLNFETSVFALGFS